jgi:hypothetical protein
MEACLGVEREVNKVLDKFHSLQSSNDKSLSEIQFLLRSAKNEAQYEGEKTIKITMLIFVLEYVANVNHEQTLK